MAIGKPHFSIITLDVNGLNSSRKKHKVAGWVKNKTQPYATFKRHISAARTNIDPNERVRNDTS